MFKIFSSDVQKVVIKNLHTLITGGPEQLIGVSSRTRSILLVSSSSRTLPLFTNIDRQIQIDICYIWMYGQKLDMDRKMLDFYRCQVMERQMLNMERCYKYTVQRLEMQTGAKPFVGQVTQRRIDYRQIDIRY